MIAAALTAELEEQAAELFTTAAYHEEAAEGYLHGGWDPDRDSCARHARVHQATACRKRERGAALVSAVNHIHGVSPE